MIARLLLVSVLIAHAGIASAAEDTPLPSAREMLKARLAEEAKQPAKAPAPARPTARANPGEPQGSATQSVTTVNNPIIATAPAASAEKQKAGKAAQPATVLPKMEVRKGRITELDQQLAKQEQEIAREKKNTKPSELDKALNDSKIARPLSVFGGESTQFRQRVASERVNLMEEEKDLLVAIAQAKTKEEKAELQKQLEFLRMERRELEKALR